jgi:hypothetical protein
MGEGDATIVVRVEALRTKVVSDGDVLQEPHPFWHPMPQ